jgi:voltage-gated potassium channel
MSGIPGGDIVPSQTAGKVIAGLLMLGGLSLISVITAAITSGFVARAQTHQRAAGKDPVLQKLDELTLELRAVKAELEQLSPSTGPDESP